MTAHIIPKPAIHTRTHIENNLRAHARGAQHGARASAQPQELRAHALCTRSAPPHKIRERSETRTRGAVLGRFVFCFRGRAPRDHAQRTPQHVCCSSSCCCCARKSKSWNWQTRDALKRCAERFSDSDAHDDRSVVGASSSGQHTHTHTHTDLYSLTDTYT